MLYEDYADGLLSIVKRAVRKTNSNPKYFADIKNVTYKINHNRKYEKLSVKLETSSETKIIYSLVDVNSEDIRMSYKRAVESVIYNIKSDPEIREYPCIEDIEISADTNKIKIEISINIQSDGIDNTEDNSKLYHISIDRIDNVTIYPTIPKNFMTDNNYEDSTVKRICFSTSIDGCLRAMSKNCTGLEFFVYTPMFSNHKVVVPTKKQVPDVDITNERWITEPLKLKYIGKIRVIKVREGSGYKYRYGNYSQYVAELYDWDWEWIEQIDESIYGNEISDVESLANNGLAYIRNYIDMVRKLHGYPILDYFYPSFKNISLKTRENTMLGGRLFSDKYDSSLNWYKVGISNEGHINFCKILHELVHRILDKKPVTKSDLDTAEMWQERIKENIELLKLAKPNSIDYLIICQKLHDMYWDPLDELYDDAVILQNIAVIISMIFGKNKPAIAKNLKPANKYIGENLNLPVYNLSSIRLIMDNINDLDISNISECSTHINKILSECNYPYKISSDHPFAKYADLTMISPIKCFEYYKELNENILFNNDDLILNLDKWKTDSNNILYITGLSGSGKTTLAEKYEKKYNAYMFELDGLEHNYDSSNNHILDSVIQKCPEIKSIHNKTAKSSERIKILKHAADIAISIMRSDINNLYIVEGVQIFQWYDAKNIISKPCIILGTSAVTSLVRRLKRESDDGKIHLTNTIKSDILKLIYSYFKNNKMLDNYRNSASSTVTETSSPAFTADEEKDMDTPYIHKLDYNWYGKNLMELKRESPDDKELPDVKSD